LKKCGVFGVFSGYFILNERGRIYPRRDGLGVKFCPSGQFLVFRYPFWGGSKMIAEEMNSGSDELTYSE